MSTCKNGYIRTIGTHHGFRDMLMAMICINNCSIISRVREWNGGGGGGGL